MGETTEGATAGAPAVAASPGRRADAERNIAAILDAALVCFNRGPDVTMTEIAKAAGVGRVTLYGHFPSREAVIEALLARSLAEADAAFAEADLEHGSATDALARLTHLPWLLGRYSGLFAAGTRHLGPAHVRRLHDAVFERIRRLVVRGQEEGEFRTDLPVEWLMACIYALAHAALTEIDEGRTPVERAADLLTVTLLDLLTVQPA